MNNQLKKIEVSIIMPIFNVDRFLKESISSILNQTFNNFELIIIDDGSTDDSLKIIKDFREKDDRIVLIENKKNEGIIKSLNKGINISKGKYIARMDGDDISSLNRIETQYSFMEKNKDVFLVGSGSKNIDEMGKIISIFNPIISERKIVKKLPKKNCFRHPSIFFRKENILYRDKLYYAEDYDLYLRLLSEKKRMTNLPFHLINYRIRKDSTGTSNSGYQILFANKAREFYFQREKRGIDDYNNFDPIEIISKSKDINFIKAEIKANFKINNFEKVKSLSKKYFKDYKFSLTIIFYYILSFFNISFINFIRKILFIYFPGIYFKFIYSFYKFK